MSSMSTSPSSPNSKVHSPSSSPNASVSLILAFSGSSPYALTIAIISSKYQLGERALTTASLIGRVFDNDICFAVLKVSERKQDDIALINPDLRCVSPALHIARPLTFLRIFPLIWASRFSPSKHCASRRPFPSILVTCAYSWPSSRNTNSRLSSSFSFFPLLRFLPPCRLSKWT